MSGTAFFITLACVCIVGVVIVLVVEKNIKNKKK